MTNPRDNARDERPCDDGRFPDPCATIEIDWAYPAVHAQRIAAGFRAREMEEKWNLRFDGQRLWCARSWTHMVVFVVDFEPTPGGGLRAVRLHALRDEQRYRSRGIDDDTATARFLIDVLLVGRRESPPTACGDDAIRLWSTFGTAAFPPDALDPP